MNLTKTVRKHIAKSLVEDAFKARITALESIEHQLAEDTYALIIGPHEAAMNSLPNGWVYCSTQLKLKYMSPSSERGLAYSCDLRLANPDPMREHIRYYSLNLPKARVLPHFMMLSAFEIERDGEIHQRFNDLSQSRKDLHDQLVELEDTTLGYLASFRNSAKLIEEWPEAAKHLPPEPEKASLPVVRTEDFKKSLSCAISGNC